MFKLDQSQYSLFSAVRSRNGCEYIYIYIFKWILSSCTWKELKPQRNLYICVVEISIKDYQTHAAGLNRLIKEHSIPSRSCFIELAFKFQKVSETLSRDKRKLDITFMNNLLFFFFFFFFLIFSCL